MPLSTQYDANTSLLRIVGNGALSMHERRESVRQILANDEFGGESDILIDVSGVTNAPVGDEFLDIAKLVQLLQTRFAGRVGIVNMTEGHVTVSQLVTLSADLDRNSVQAFYSEAEALAWFNQ